MTTPLVKRIPRLYLNFTLALHRDTLPDYLQLAACFPDRRVPYRWVMYCMVKITLLRTLSRGDDIRSLHASRRVSKIDSGLQVATDIASAI